MFIKSLRNANKLDSDVLYRYSKTVQLWLFHDTGGNLVLGAMETACIPHNRTLTDYTVRRVSIGKFPPKLNVSNFKEYISVIFEKKNNE